MNKFIRGMLITFAICLVIGGGVVIAGIALGGTLGDATVTIGERWGGLSVVDIFDHGFSEVGKKHTTITEMPDTSNATDELTVLADEIRNLEIVLRNCDLRMEASDNNQISVVVEEDEEENCVISQNGDKLEIIDTRKKKNTTSLKSIRVVMRVPKQHSFDKVNLDMGAGNIRIDRLAAQDIDIDGGAGSLDAEVLIVQNQLDADLGVGDFYIKEATLGQTDIECGVGSFEVERCQLTDNADISGGVGNVKLGLLAEKTDFNYELTCGMGELELFDRSYKAFGKDKDIDNDAPHTISLECGVGSMVVYQAK